VGVSVGVVVGEAVAVGGVVGEGVGSNPGRLPEHPDKRINITDKRVNQDKRVNCNKIILRKKLSRQAAPRTLFRFTRGYCPVHLTVKVFCLITLYFTIVPQFPV
jgi:hypothetical protein